MKRTLCNLKKSVEERPNTITRKTGKFRHVYSTLQLIKYTLTILMLNLPKCQSSMEYPTDDISFILIII